MIFILYHAKSFLTTKRLDFWLFGRGKAFVFRFADDFRTEFDAQNDKRDNGNSAVAGVSELAAKAAIIALALPLIKSAVALAKELINI